MFRPKRTLANKTMCGQMMIPVVILANSMEKNRELAEKSFFRICLYQT
jgi:hypothetical protein